MEQINTKVLIIGSGPAGLSCASAINHATTDYVLIEEGKNLPDRIHANVADIAKGIGGAGLFSDGKFSFYPSGSKVYGLRKDFIEEAYKTVSSELELIGVHPYPFNLITENSTNYTLKNKKVYNSAYVDLNHRKALATNILSKLSGKVIVNTKAIHISKYDHGYITTCMDEAGQQLNIHSKAIVLSTGKFGTVGGLINSISSFNDYAYAKRRFEFGLRIETDSRSSFFNNNSENDVKYIWKDEQGLEFRTFCTCRSGEVWNVPCGDMHTLSGRADGIKSDYSNFGFLVRYEEDFLERGADIWRQLQLRLKKPKVSVQPLDNFLGLNKLDNANTNTRPSWFPANYYYFSTLSDELGSDLTTDLKDGLGKLIEMYPDLLEYETYCMFPAVEGVGYFPVLDSELQLAKENIWFAGDIVGTFRGLVPAFVSGYVAGLSVIEKTMTK